MKSFHLIVHGSVQGVFFRKFTQLKARELGLKGWVRNAADGTVEMAVQGEQDSLDAFTAWCHHGPENAVVNKVVTTEMPFENFTSFEIIR